MKVFIICCAAIVGGASFFAQTPQSVSTVRVDPAFDAIVSPGTTMETLKEDFGFINGIIWIKESRGFTFGDADGKSLYMAASTRRTRIRLNNAGAR
jgi:hypothetical protein